jgi:hypothetical protein
MLGLGLMSLEFLHEGPSLGRGFGGLTPKLLPFTRHPLKVVFQQADLLGHGCCLSPRYRRLVPQHRAQNLKIRCLDALLGKLFI